MCGGQTGEDFGCQQCGQSMLGRNHGWIECESTSFPGKVYYFHTGTRCSTWQRPVPRNTRLPRYKKWRDLGPPESHPDENQPSSDLGVSGTECPVFSSAPPSEFELHARRMQIYLRKNTDYLLSGENGCEVRDKLLECYKRAKSELAKNLHLKKLPRKKPARKQNVKPAAAKPRPIKKPTLIIRECNGVKTISYDHVPPELPAADRMPDLSETTIDSFNVVPPILVTNENPRRTIELMNVKDVDLSESSETTSRLEYFQS